MDTVEEINGTYFCDGLSNLTSGQMFFWILANEAMRHFAIDFIAADSILSGRNDIPTRQKPGGAIVGTSKASKFSRQVFGKTQIPFGWKWPTWVGGPIPVSSIKHRAVRNLGTFVGRTIPVLGIVILAADISTIMYKTLNRYNTIARPADKLW